jgi:hypothetical protein
LLQQRHGVGHATPQGIHIPQDWANGWEPEREIQDMVEFQTALEHGDSLGQISFAEVEKTGGKMHRDQAVWIHGRLSNMDRLCAASDSLGKLANLGQARVRTLSSRKKGLPAVRAIRGCLSAARLGSSPSRAWRNSSALAGGSGSRRTWV